MSHLPHLQPVALHARLAACLALAMGASVAHAQQRVEVIRLGLPRAEAGDSTERLRLVQRRIDSLMRIYDDESRDISEAERRRVMELINVTANQLRSMIVQGVPIQERLPVGGSVLMRGQVAPLGETPSSAAMSRALMQVREGAAAAPRGWIGFVTEGVSVQWVEGSELFVRYLSYPRILSVDPSSPAQIAGIEPSDTLVAYDGRDVRGNDISLTQLLRPNAKVNVRLRRDGKVRDVPVIVGTASNRIMIRRGDETREIRLDGGNLIAGGTDAPRAAHPPMLALTPAPIRTRAPQAPPGGGAIAAGYSLSFTNNGVAGAQLQTLSEDWLPTVGVSTGVLVVIAPPGSPARESGLQGADVIIRAGGQIVRTVAEVREQVRQATVNGEHSVDLELLRNKKPVKLTLKW